MKDQLSKILNIVVILLLAISAIISVVFYVGNSKILPDTEFADQIIALGGILDLFLNWSLGLVFAAAIASLLFPIINMVSDPKNSKKTLLMIGAMASVIFVSYGVASNEIPIFIGYEKFFYEEISMDPNQFAKYVDTGLWSMYVLGGLSLLAILYYEVAKFFK